MIDPVKKAAKDDTPMSALTSFLLPINLVKHATPTRAAVENTQSFFALVIKIWLVF